MSAELAGLVSDLEVDTSKFVAPLENAADVAEQSGERIIRVIHEQEASWLAMVTNVVPAVAKATAAVAGFAAAHVSLIRQRELLASVSNAWNISGAAVLRYSRLGLSVASNFVPALKVVAVGVTAATLAYKIGTNEIVQNSIRQSEVGQRLSRSYDELTGSIGRVQDSLSNLAGTALGTVESGLSSITATVIEGGLSLAQYHPGVISTNWALGKLADGMEWTAQKTEEFNKLIPTIKLYTESWGQVSEEAAAKFYEEGQALEQLATETARVIALQEGQRAAFQGLGNLQQEAAAAAEHAAEVARLASLKTIEAVDNETRALQEKAKAAILAGKPIDEGQLKSLFGTLENQRQGIQSGRVKPDEPKQSPAEMQIKQAEQALAKLTLGETEAAIAAAKMTDTEAARFRALQAEIESTTAAQQQWKAAVEAGSKEWERVTQLQQQGTERIEALKDRIDLLNKSATNAEVTMRELTRQGFTEDQVAEIGRLTDQLDQLEKKKTTAKRGENRAVLAGSSEAASIVLRGVAGVPKDDRQFKEQQKTNQLLKDVNRSIKDNKPPEPKTTD